MTLSVSPIAAVSTFFRSTPPPRCAVIETRHTRSVKVQHAARSAPVGQKAATVHARVMKQEAAWRAYAAAINLWIRGDIPARRVPVCQVTSSEHSHLRQDPGPTLLPPHAHSLCPLYLCDMA